MKVKISITSWFALVSAVITIAGIGEYIAFQFHYHPGYTVKYLMIEHGWHVIGLGLITYGVSYLFFHYQIRRPIASLWLKCYAITKDYGNDINTNSAIKEIQDIANAINMLEAQLAKNNKADNADEAMIEKN